MAYGWCYSNNYYPSGTPIWEIASMEYGTLSLTVYESELPLYIYKNDINGEAGNMLLAQTISSYFWLF